MRGSLPWDLRKYSLELRGRGTRTGMGGVGRPGSGQGARSVGSPGSRGHHGALRTWVRQARDRIRAPGPGSPGGEDAERIKECEKEVRQLRRASAILKERVGLSIAAECGRPSR